MEPPVRTFEQEIDHVTRNAHRFSEAQRTRMIAECHPGFLALMQFERDVKSDNAAGIPERTTIIRHILRNKELI